MKWYQIRRNSNVIFICKQSCSCVPSIHVFVASIVWDSDIDAGLSEELAECNQLRLDEFFQNPWYVIHHTRSLNNFLVNYGLTCEIVD